MDELTIRCGSCWQPRVLRVGQLVVCRLVSNGELPGTLTAIDDSGEKCTAVFPGRSPVSGSPTWFMAAAEDGRHAQTTMERDAALALDALAFAAEARRERVDQACGDCEMDRMCESHATDLDRADEYDQLAARIREQTS